MTAPARRAGKRMLAPWTEAAAQSGATEQTAHRPWPLPRGPWLQGQTWRDLLFAHWPLSVEDVRRVVPRELAIDTFDGTAWLGITPFLVTGLRLHGTPPVPLVSRFLETNVRTYVTVGGRPGIWFFSLDAASLLAVAGARRSYRLPYFHARMRAREHAGAISYRVVRASPPASLDIAYRPARRGRRRGSGNAGAFSDRALPLVYDAPPPATTARRRHPPSALARRQDVVIWPPRIVA